MKAISVGSVCSGIEAASVAWKDIGYDFKWFSEISDFPSKVLNLKFPQIPNLGDMSNISDKLSEEAVEAPDLICGGTPCQAFSLAGLQKGLNDDRGNLTLKFVDIINTNDQIRSAHGKGNTIVLWENVEGVLRDRTNAFGCFLASLAGASEELKCDKWPSAGIIHGPKRNIAWRVLDAKYFGLPHQRKRLYVLAGGKDFFPENIIFDGLPNKAIEEYSYDDRRLKFKKDGHDIQVFRAYTDCLYSAYGTKWNGNAAAYNGSLFITQNERLRRLSPLECERLMGFPDNYTDIPKSRPTNRYQALGNSWAVPVIRWLGKRIQKYQSATDSNKTQAKSFSALRRLPLLSADLHFYPILTDLSYIKQKEVGVFGKINGSDIPESPVIGSLFDIVDVNAPENFYISPVGCKGILRRKEERKIAINPHLETVLSKISSEMSDSAIEAVSRVQKRGRFSTDVTQKSSKRTGT